MLTNTLPKLPTDLGEKVSSNLCGIIVYLHQSIFFGSYIDYAVDEPACKVSNFLAKTELIYTINRLNP
ncbi:hypothetical protein GCM10027190_34390 [Spirosoma areae]